MKLTLLTFMYYRNLNSEKQILEIIMSTSFTKQKNLISCENLLKTIINNINPFKNIYNVNIN